MAKEEQAKKPYSKEKIGVTVMLVGLTAAIFLAIGYWAGTQSESLQCNETVDLSEAPPVPDIPQKNSEAMTATTTATEEIASWKTYTNDEYGFSLVLDDNWRDYKVIDWVKESTTEGPAPADDVIYVCLPSSENNTVMPLEAQEGYACPLEIRIYQENIYESLSQQAGENEGVSASAGHKLGTKNGQVFVSSQWLDQPTDLPDINSKEIDKVISSFQFIK